VQAKLVAAGSIDPMAALNEALGREASERGRSMRGWVAVTHDLDTIAVPPELLAAGNVQIGIDVAHWRPEGAAWGSYVVFFVTPGGMAGNVAVRPHRVRLPSRS
jgi:hypothetical protein